MGMDHATDVREGLVQEPMRRLIGRRPEAAGDDPAAAPGVLVRSHGPFAWGVSAAEAAHHAEAIERLASMAFLTLSIDPGTPPVGEALLGRHFDRKHGATATYGQRPGDAI